MRFGLTGEGVEPVKNYGSRIGVKYSFEPTASIGAGASIRLPFTKVPLVEPKSRI
jgi:hypothetical protein